MEWGWNIRDVQHPQEVSPPIHPLLRSLMENPELGGYVEHVNFWGSKNDWISKTTYNLWAPEESPKLADSELQAAMQRVQRFAQRSEALGRGDSDAYVSLTLAFLPNLCSLILSADFFSNSRFLGPCSSTHCILTGEDSRSGRFHGIPCCTTPNLARSARAKSQLTYFPALGTCTSSSTHRSWKS